MKNLYAVWAIVLAVLLELGIFYLYYFTFIGTATTLSSAFAVAAFTVAALMLRDTGFRHRDHLLPAVEQSLKMSRAGKQEPEESKNRQ